MLLVSALNSINNSNIGLRFLGKLGLHLNEHGASALALNFVKRISSIFSSGFAKEKAKTGSPKYEKLLKFMQNHRSDTLEAVYASPHNLNKDTIKCKKNLELNFLRKNESKCRE